MTKTASETAAALIALIPRATAARWQQAGPGEVGINVTVDQYKTFSALLSNEASPAQVAAQAERINRDIATMSKRGPNI